MNNATRMRRLERVGDLYAQLEELRYFQPSVTDAVLHCLAFEQLHGDEVLPAEFIDLIDGAYAGMVECARRARLALEALHRCRLCARAFRQELQRHAAPQLGVFRAVHHSHASAAKFFLDTIMRDGFAGHEGIKKRSAILRLPIVAVKHERFLAHAARLGEQTFTNLDAVRLSSAI